MTDKEGKTSHESNGFILEKLKRHLIRHFFRNKNFSFSDENLGFPCQCFENNSQFPKTFKVILKTKDG